MLYFIGWSLFFIYFKLFLGFRVVGRENVPKKGAFIFASNHQSYLDPILLGTSLYRGLYYMARDTLFDTPRRSFVMRSVHAFPVKRSKSDLRAIKQAIDILNDHKPLVIFPEGTRSKDERLKTPKRGIGFIAAKTKVPVVPAYIKGSFDVMPGGRDTLKHANVTVYIGKPIEFNALNDGVKIDDIYQHISDSIMSRIDELKARYEDTAGKEDRFLFRSKTGCQDGGGRA
jgi:1-acyl-sn-glycerol-3-phosphate acyltransferase